MPCCLFNQRRCVQSTALLRPRERFQGNEGQMYLQSDDSWWRDCPHMQTVLRAQSGPAGQCNLHQPARAAYRVHFMQSSASDAQRQMCGTCRVPAHQGATCSFGTPCATPSYHIWKDFYLSARFRVPHAACVSLCYMSKYCGHLSVCALMLSCVLLSHETFLA